MIRLLYILIGYALGCIQTAYIIGKIRGVDLRTKGSGNLGATNALRVMGAKLGLITFGTDILKAVIAFIVMKYLLNGGDLGGLYGGLGVVLGHNFPFYLKFKGGKGIAVTAGVMLVLNPLITLIIIAAMVGLIIITKYVSLGSIIGMLSMAVFGVFKYHNDVEMMILILVLATLAIYMHRSNIKRLLTGTENKLNLKKKQEKK